MPVGSTSTEPISYRLRPALDGEQLLPHLQLRRRMPLWPFGRAKAVVTFLSHHVGNLCDELKTIAETDSANWVVATQRSVWMVSDSGTATIDPGLPRARV